MLSRIISHYHSLSTNYMVPQVHLPLYHNNQSNYIKKKKTKQNSRFYVFPKKQKFLQRFSDVWLLPWHLILCHEQHEGWSPNEHSCTTECRSLGHMLPPLGSCGACSTETPSPLQAPGPPSASYGRICIYNSCFSFGFLSRSLRAGA